MKNSQGKIIEWFLRLSLSAGFLSAVADRFGLWNKQVSVWGNWDNFLAYTATLIPFVPKSLVPIPAALATALEILFAIALLTNFKTVFFAKCSGALLLSFALAMTFSVGIKAPLDYSVFAGAAAAFALSLLAVTKPQKTA
jgi:uncharacterized membrane protein YphA (DoxX/SURF4 family)